MTIQAGETSIQDLVVFSVSQGSALRKELDHLLDCAEPNGNHAKRDR